MAKAKVIFWGQPAQNNVIRPGDALIPARKTEFEIQPCFQGTVLDIDLIVDVPMTPIEFAIHFQACGTPTEYEITSHPDGLVFDAQTGTLSGTPNRVSSYNPFVTATNKGGSAQTNIFNIGVSDPPP